MHFASYAELNTIQNKTTQAISEARIMLNCQKAMQGALIMLGIPLLFCLVVAFLGCLSPIAPESRIDHLERHKSPRMAQFEGEGVLEDVKINPVIDLGWIKK